jgi:hypothetical protein
MKRLYILILVVVQTSFFSQNSISRHVDCYKSEQIVYFVSSDNKTDTIQIHYIDPVKDRCNGEIRIPNEYVYNRLLIEFSSTDTCFLAVDDTSGYDLTLSQLKTLINSSVDSKDFIFLNCKEFWPDIATDKGIIYKTFLGKIHTDTLKANGKSITNYYVIKSYNYRKKKKPTYRTKHSHIDFFIWTNAEGLTAYKTKKGIWWTKKSSS